MVSVSMVLEDRKEHHTSLPRRADGVDREYRLAGSVSILLPERVLPSYR